METITNTGHAPDPAKPYDVVTADDLIAGLNQLVTRAHTHGIKVYGATLTPFVGAKYQSPAGEEMRQPINKRTPTTNQLHGLIAFHKVTPHPPHPCGSCPSPSAVTQNGSGCGLHIESSPAQTSVSNRSRIPSVVNEAVTESRVLPETTANGIFPWLI